LAKPVIEHRLNLLTEIIHLLLKMMATERGQTVIKEDSEDYEIDAASND
jgi:hypothetical protein